MYSFSLQGLLKEVVDGFLKFQELWQIIMVPHSEPYLSIVNWLPFTTLMEI